MEWGLRRIFIWGSVIFILKPTHQTGNVAPRGVATQSAGPTSAADGADMAVDDTRSARPDETCASVPQQDHPWWQLDLRSVYRITAVSVTAAACCPEQLDGAEIRVGLGNATHNQRCATITTGGQSTVSYQCEVQLARFVHVLLPGRQRNLTVCEVRVYGTVLENVALRGVARQSSSRWRTAGRAGSVIDGVQFTTCSLTKDQPGQWVMVDLLVPYTVTVVQLAFAEECPGQVEVFVDDKRCSGNTSCSQALMTLDCGGVVGWNVTVFHPDVPPSLCEVEVFSIWDHPDNPFPQRPLTRDHCSLELCSRNYVLIDEGPTTWAGAQTFCRQRSMDLAAIHSAQDMNAVVDAMQEKTPQDFWIGLYRDQPSWRWSLSDGGRRGDATDPFRNWAPGEPGQQPGQHCAGMQDTGEWRDLDCGSLNFYVCVDGIEGASQTKILVKRPTTWADAQQNCRKSYSDLVRVKDPAENEEIRKTVPAGKLVWIGLYGDSWKWSDGGDAMFRYWRPGQADGSGEGAKCAQVSGGAWRVESCDAKSMVLCYYYKKRTLVKISAGIDMCDPAIQQQIQQQLEGKLLKMGNNNFKVHWRRTTRQLPDKNEETRCEPAKEG